MSRMVNAGGLGIYNINLSDDEKSDLWRAQFNWSYYGRHPDSVRLQNPWVGLWTAPKCVMQDNRSIVGNDNMDSWGVYENQTQFRGGQGKYFYVIGFVRDSGGSAVTGAVVQCFRTSDDFFTGMSISNSDGSYSVKTPFSGQDHYLVAYLTGSPDIAGTTVNTLQPV